MLSYCLKCKKKKMRTVKILKLQGQNAQEQYVFQNVQRVIVKNRILLNTRKLLDY